MCDNIKVSVSSKRTWSTPGLDVKEIGADVYSMGGKMFTDDSLKEVYYPLRQLLIDTWRICG